MFRKVIKCDSEITELLNRNPIRAADIGAAGGIDARWESAAKFVTWILFEPDKNAFDRLCKYNKGNNIIFNYALSNERGTKPFYFCKLDRCNSLYVPALDSCRDFDRVKDLEIEGKGIINCTTLDGLLETSKINGLDYIKLDTQGNELDILKGARKLLIQSHTFALVTEYLFLQEYKNLPSFSELHSFVTNLGYELFDMKFHYHRRSSFAEGFRFPGQIEYCDALYIKKLDVVKEISKDLVSDFVSKSVFISIFLGYPDYALSLINKAEDVHSVKLHGARRLVTLNMKFFRGIGSAGKVISYTRIITDKILCQFSARKESGSSNVGFDAFNL